MKIFLKNLRGFVIDGVSVMIGKIRGLVVLLKKDVISLVVVYCVCYRLVLVCTDINEELVMIKAVEIEVI